MPGQAWNMWEAKSRKKASPPSFDPAALLSGGGGGGGGAKIVKWPERKRVRQKIHGGKRGRRRRGREGISHFIHSGGEEENKREAATGQRRERRRKKRRLSLFHSIKRCFALLCFFSPPCQKGREEEGRLTSPASFRAAALLGKAMGRSVGRSVGGFPGVWN